MNTALKIAGGVALGIGLVAIGGVIGACMATCAIAKAIYEEEED